jgi:hypothetical protein
MTEYKLARGQRADMGYSKKKGTPYVRVWFNYVDDQGEPAGGGIFWDGYLTDATEYRTLESLTHCGWKGDFKEFSGIDCEIVQLVLEDETYEGNTRTKVQWVNKPSLRSIPEEHRMGDMERERYAKNLGGVVAGILGGEEKPSAAKPQEDTFSAAAFAGGTADEDDIPFAPEHSWTR